MIDALCFTGYYPFRKLAISRLSEVVSKLANEGFDHIFVLHLNSLFHRNPWLANDELVHESKEVTTRVKVSLIAGVNPEYATTRERLVDYKNTFKAVLIAPLYHGFKLRGKPVENLLKMLKDLELALVILGYLEDPREMHRAYRPRYRIAVDDLKVFIKYVKDLGYSRVLLSSIPSNTLFPLLSGISDTSIYVDVSSDSLYGPVYDYVKTVVESAGEDLVVFSSKTPLTYTKAVLFKVIYSDISEKAKKKILEENARKLFNIT